MSRNKSDVDLLGGSSAQDLTVQLVGHASRVLVVGSGVASLGAALARPGRTVWGVDRKDDLSDADRARFDRLVVADADGAKIGEIVGEAQFDAVVLGDVIGWATDPVTVLREMVAVLADGGAIVLSVPNVTHGAVRLALLQGRWEGVRGERIGRPGLRRFAKDEVVDLVHSAGLRMTDLAATVRDPLGTSVELDAAALPGTIVDWMRRQADATVYEFVVRAAKAEDVTGPEPIDPVMAAELVPPDDEHAHRAERERERDLELLRHRDAVIGLEAATARAQLAVAKAEQQRDAAIQRHAEAVRDVHLVYSSRTWRIGQGVTAPLRLVRLPLRLLRRGGRTR